MLHLPPGGEPQGSLCLLIQCLYLLESTAGADRVRLSSRDSDTEMETDVWGVRRRGALRTGPRGQRGEPGCDGSHEGLSPFRRPPRSGRWPSESSQVAARGWAFLPAVAGLRPRAVRLQGEAVNLAERRLSQAESNARGGARHAEPGS